MRTLRHLVQFLRLAPIEVVMLLQRLHQTQERWRLLVTALLVGTLWQMVQEQRM